MKIQDWLKDNNKTLDDFARMIKRYRVRAHRIVKGMKPNDKEMCLIFQGTKGQVTANDFYDLPKSPKTPPD